MVASGSLSHQEGKKKEEERTVPNFSKKLVTFISLAEYHNSLRKKRSILIMLAFVHAMDGLFSHVVLLVFSAVIMFVARSSRKLFISKNLRMVEIYNFLETFGKYSELSKGKGGFEETCLFCTISMSQALSRLSSK